MCSLEILMRKSVGAHGPLPPNLTESEFSDSDSESETQSDQECTKGESSLKYQPDPDLDATNNANNSLRMTLSENIVEEGIVVEAKLDLTKNASSEMEYSSQEPY